MKPFRRVVQKLRQIHVVGRDALRVVSHEVDRHSVIHVEPLRMVVHFLDGDGGGSHEAEGVNEVGEICTLCGVFR